MYFIFMAVGVVGVGVAVALLTRKEPYVCPPGMGIVATVSRHSDAGPTLVTLGARGIDAQVVEETAKPVLRRVLLSNRNGAPVGPWHVVVPTDRLAEAEQALAGGSRSDVVPA